MKLKAIVRDDTPDELIDLLNKIRPLILAKVVGPHLHRPNFTAAEFYVQKCDFVDAETHDHMCEVRFTGISGTEDRCIADFKNALSELAKAYAAVIVAFLNNQGRTDKPISKINLYASLFLDFEINGSPILELPVIPVKKGFNLQTLDKKH